MCGRVKREPARSTHVGVERLLRVLQDLLGLLLGQLHPHHRQPTSQVRFDHRPNAGELRRALMGRDCDGRHPSVRTQGGQLLPITEHEWHKHRIGGAPTCDSFQECHLSSIGGVVLKRVPDRDGQPSCRHYYTRNLVQRLAAICEKHEAELAHDGVEGMIREGERLGHTHRHQVKQLMLRSTG